MSAAEPATALRIGDLARLAGTTTRTIRYYEEIGLLDAAGDRPAGQHRLYGEADLARLREILRLRDLLGVSLDELKELVEGEDRRVERRRAFHASDSPAERERLLDEAIAHIDRQLELVDRRTRALDTLRAELLERRERAVELLTNEHEAAAEGTR